MCSPPSWGPAAHQVFLAALKADPAKYGGSDGFMVAIFLGIGTMTGIVYGQVGVVPSG